MDRKRVAAVLEEIASLLDLKGENPFKSRAYTAAARTLEGLDEDFDALVREERLTDLKGVGEALAQKIATLATTGRLPYHEELKAEVPTGLLEMIRIPGLGPKKARALHDGLGIETVEQLAAACRDGRLSAVTGFGKRSETTILAGIEFLGRQVGYGLLSEATRLASALVERLAELDGVVEARFAGSLRRRKETVRDIDLLASHGRGADPGAIIERFTRMPDVERVLGAGDTKATVLMRSGRQVDLRVVSREEFPFALHYFTGSAEHNIAIRRRAQSMELKINEYGLWKGDRRIRCAGEQEIFERLDLAWIPPELREDRGEIEAAAGGSLPHLVEAGQIRGILHVHSTWSDGIDSLEAMVKRAVDLGYEFVGISDHSRSAGYAGGLSLERVEHQSREIDSLRRKYRKIRILHGTESDILKDGSLDYPADLLRRFDFVIGSIHSSFTLDEELQTRRVETALANPYLTVLGHPTGRLLLQREGFRVDMERVLRAASKARKIVEINANPRRLDLDATACRRAREMGVMTSINPDAHSADDIEDVSYGVDTARRGWLEASHVANTRPWEDLRALVGGVS